MDVQKRYWQEFVDLKRDAIYIGLYRRKTESTDRFLSGFSAVMSSSAVAAWVLWRQTVVVDGVAFDFRFVWSVLIMVAQVIGAVKEYLPYKKRLQALWSLSNALNSLALVMETDWFKVTRGMLAEAEVHELQMAGKRHVFEAREKSFGNMTLPEDDRLMERAMIDLRRYVASFFTETNA